MAGAAASLNVLSRAGQNRRFGYAIAISIVVHAVVLYGGIPVPRESLQEPLAPPPLVTRLVELPKPTEASPPVEKKAPPPKREARHRAIEEPSPQPASVAEPAPPEPPQAAVPATASAPSAPVAPAPVDSRAVEAATAAQYRLQLIQYAQRNKPPYPLMARENNWTGDVTLDIVLRADGRAELGLRRGSGHGVLDKLALDTYQQALRAVPVPSALQGRQVRLESLRVIYNLTE